MTTLSPGLSDSIASVLDDAQPCPHCDSSSHIAGGLCVGCLLGAGLDPADDGESETLNDILAEVRLPDQNWRLGNYEVLEEIGRGGMGVIYRARQRHSRRIVAVKRVLSYHADSRETLARFRREAQAAASLDHPNILPIFEVSESEDGLPFFSMKFAPGGTLQQVAPALRKDPRQCVALVAKIARAVQYAHSRGILHRDLKPGNILLDARGEPLVSDFGLAKWLDTASDLTRTLTIFGTPGYIAPEQASADAAELKPTADIYSLGAILFDLLAGRPPFLGAHALSVIRQAAETPAPKLRTLSKLADRDLETICSRCLEREPSARYRSAHDLAEDLERWLEGRSIIARPASPPMRSWRWAKRNPKLAGSALACALLTFAVGTSQLEHYKAARAQATALHSISVAPLLDLDAGRPDPTTTAAIATSLQHELSQHGTVRVTLASPDKGKKNRSSPDRVVLRGTKRIRNGNVRLSLKLINTANGKVLHRQIVESNSVEDATDEAWTLGGASIYTILDTPDLTDVELRDTDPAWFNPSTRERLITGRAVMERRTLVDIDRAIDLFDEVIKAEPQSTIAHSYLAEVQFARAFMTGDSRGLSSADASARTAISLNADIAEPHKALSSVQYGQGHFRESLEEVFTAYELSDADDERLSSRVAANLQALGRLDKAVTWYRQGMGKNSRPGYNEFSLADCLTELTDDEHAAAMYRRATSLFPELPEGWIGLCRLALLQRNPELARRISSEHLAHYHDFVFSNQMIAQVEFFTRRFSEAETLYRDLASNNPNGGRDFYGALSYQSVLGHLRLVAHDEENGRRILTETLNIESESLRSTPSHPGILYRLAAIEASLGNVDSALQHLRKATNAGWVNYRAMELDPRFDSLSENDEFRYIIQTTHDKVTKTRNEMLNDPLNKSPDLTAVP
jgi:serine/threonine protein kinase/tetratricopeptide (TPR) repeat protein